MTGSAARPAARLGFSRTCHLADFPGVATVADWQQALANTVWSYWTTTYPQLAEGTSLVHNWSGVGFLAPGPAIYYGRGEPMNGAPPPVVAVYGLSVLDHAEAPLRFLSQAGQVLPPDGLVFVTFAFWDAEGPDTAAGHEHRVRIYDARRSKKLIQGARDLGFQTFGGVDWHYHGHYLEDHSLASLVLTRRGRGPELGES